MDCIPNHYELLGVSASADTSTIRSAYCRLSKALHPDTTSLPVDDAARRFQQVCEAYELLSDPMLRKAYDESLEAVNSSKNVDIDDPLSLFREASNNARRMDVRRSFSGGELFALLSLGIAFLLSLLLAIGFAFTQGREWQIQPSWLVLDQNLGSVIAQYPFNVSFAFSPNSIESTFSRSLRVMAS